MLLLRNDCNLKRNFLRQVKRGYVDSTKPRELLQVKKKLLYCQKLRKLTNPRETYICISYPFEMITLTKYKIKFHSKLLKRKLNYGRKRVLILNLPVFTYSLLVFPHPLPGAQGTVYYAKPYKAANLKLKITSIR